MFDSEAFFKNLDEMYAEKRAKEVGNYLIEGLRKAALAHDEGAALMILNELIGYYRAFGMYEACESCSKQALALAGKMGLEGTVNYGTTLLNVATGYRAAGRHREALGYYQEVVDIYRRELPEGDYRLAALYNNIGILHEEMGNLDQALEAMRSALSVIGDVPGAVSELATTFTNLALLCFRRDEVKQAQEYLEKALALFEGMKEQHDPHYGAALAGLGEAYCRMGKYEDGVAVYEKALNEIETYYGQNDYYRVTSENLAKARQLAAAEKGRAK